MIGAGLLLALLGTSPVVRADSVGAAHLGDWSGETLTWTSSYRLPPGQRELAFAAPLAGEWVRVRPRQGEPVRDPSGAIVGARWPFEVENVEVVSRQAASVGAIGLAPPWSAGPEVQRVAIEGGRFVPDEGLGLEKHLQGWVSAGVSRSDRRRADRIAGHHVPRPGEQAVYVRDPRASLPGTLSAGGPVSGRAPWFAVGGMVGLLGLALAVARWTAPLVRAERNEAYILQHLGS